MSDTFWISFFASLPAVITSIGGVFILFLKMNVILKAVDGNHSKLVEIISNVLDKTSTPSKTIVVEGRRIGDKVITEAERQNGQ